MTFSCLGIFLNCQVLIFSDGILFDYLGWLGGGGPFSSCICHELHYISSC